MYSLHLGSKFMNNIGNFYKNQFSEKQALGTKRGEAKKYVGHGCKTCKMIMNQSEPMVANTEK